MKQLINTETEYQEALEKLEALMLANPDERSAEADELNLLIYLITSYELHTIYHSAKQIRQIVFL
jgi:antitoxin component HigA of HigAB toxin-antitoxin module